MPHILNEAKILSAIEGSTLIKNGKKEHLEGIKYDFTLGTKLLSSKYQSGIDTSTLSATEKSQLFIEPGEVVFALTEEDIEFPENICATLIPKRKLSHEGILTLGGLSIEPLYSGKLLVGLYNFSSTRFPLMPGKKLIGACFYELEATEIGNSPKPKPIYEFPRDLMIMMASYKPISNSNLLNEIANLNTQIQVLRQDFFAKDDWFKRFEENLGGQQKEIDRILQALVKEGEEREREDKVLEREIANLTQISRDALNATKHMQRVVFYAIIPLIVTLISVIIYQFFSN